MQRIIQKPILNQTMMCSIPYHDECTTRYRNKDLMASLPVIGDQVRLWPQRDV